MLHRMKILGYNLAIVISLFLFISQYSAAQPYGCLPTCDGGDMRFFVFAGTNLSSFVETEYVFGVRSDADAPTLEIGVFDGDDANSQGGIFSDWDFGGSSVITLTLYADPMEEGDQTVQLGQWSGDGSFGNNIGDPMLDNDWYTIVFPNDPAAMTENSSFAYTIVVESISPAAESINQFKIRTDGVRMVILPLQPFAFFTNIATEADTFVLWPNLEDEDFDDPGCWDPVNFIFVCSMLDQDCCIGGGPYDGVYRFFIEVPDGEGTFNTWDGDFDFGSSSPDPAQPFLCVPDGIDVDTDDPNTPNTIPPFAVGTGAVAEGVNEAAPNDDICRLDFQLPPSVVYDVINPLNDVYSNDNPSGSEEWELFNISTEPMVNPDVMVSEIPGGIWEFRTRGTDLANLNALRFEHPVIAVDEEGEPMGDDPFVLNPIFPALDDNINFLTAEHATPEGNVAFVWGKKPGQFSLGGRICNGATFGINNPRLLAIERANEFGVSTYIFYIPLFSDFEFSLQLQALDIQTCRTSNQIDQIIRKEEGG